MQPPVYVPVIKNRESEFKAIDTLMGEGKLDPRITPFVKMLIHKDEPDERRYYQTLAGLDKKFEDRMAFVDFYRCDLGDYGRVDLSKIGDLRAYSEYPDLYLDRIAEVSQHHNLIPVITIARGANNPTPAEIKQTLHDIRSKNPDARIGLCFEGAIKGYEELVGDHLHKQDFVFFDTGEQPPMSRIMETRRLKKLASKAYPILLNSPRNREAKNKEYPARGLTSIIDNSARDQFPNLGFSAFGDYAGLRNDLPLNIKTGGKGNALVLLYDFDENKFWSYMNEESDDGPSGFRNLVPKILDDMPLLNPHKDCLTCRAIEKQAAQQKFGSYSTWITYTVMRYIQQINDRLALLPG